MLLYLKVENFGIIRNIELEFGSGLNVLTGETGVGKSIILEALGTVLGRRPRGPVAYGEKKALVSAIFDPGKDLEEYKSDDGTIILSREFSPTGRSRSFLNGKPVPLSMLKEVGSRLVDFHVQGENQLLLQPWFQLYLLDAYADALDLRAKVREAFREVEEKRKRLVELKEAMRERLQRMEFLKYQIEEIESANLQPGEDKKLLEEYNLLKHSQEIYEALKRAYDLLYSKEGSVTENLGGAIETLRVVSNYLPDRVRDIISELQNAYFSIEALGEKLLSLKDAVQTDPERLMEVEKRLNLIYDLERKYGDTVDDVLKYLEKAKGELSELEMMDEEIDSLEKRLSAAEGKFKELVDRLSAVRKKFALKISKEVTNHLPDLAISHGRFEARIIPKNSPDSTGAEAVRFLFSANPDMPPGPIESIASGGELARVALAIEVVLAQKGIPTLVFDEIDVGIGGETALRVAEKLKKLSERKQVILVTHLAQIAASASTHFVVEKGVKKGKTVVSVRQVEGKSREEEIARMLGGTRTKAAIATARELIQRFSG